MSHILAELLDEHPGLFAASVHKLEQASGQPSADVRLIADILGQVHLKTRQLGLDPHDSTGKELYHALLNLVRLHDDFLVKKIGGSNPTNVIELLPLICQAAMATKTPKTAWVLKASVAKRLLKECPPKHVMKYLGFKSFDSMLKRTPVAEIFVGMKLLESPAWYDNFISHYQKFTQMDFETRQLDILQLDPKKWVAASKDFVHKERHIIMNVREMGVICVLPPPYKLQKGLTITVLSQLLHHINEVRLYSAFYKLHQMQPDFGNIIVRSLLRDEGTHVQLGGQQVHWRVVQRHFGRTTAVNHPESFEPHLQADDLLWRKTEEVLYRLEPALHFWHDMDYVGIMKDGKPLSFNLMDMALNYVNDLPYEQRVFGHFQDSLWNELYSRYMGQQAVESQVLKQLDYGSSATELLAVATRRRS